jgi:hypothetical protein
VDAAGVGLLAVLADQGEQVLGVPLPFGGFVDA